MKFSYESVDGSSSLKENFVKRFTVNDKLDHLL